MRRIGIGLIFVTALLVVAAVLPVCGEDCGGWVSLFDGETLGGWRASENPASFKVEDGKIVVAGPRGHLFYEGQVAGADFKDFEFKCKVYTHPKANSGVFFHTAYQDRGWPRKGYEVQVNATHSDKIKTGSIYAVQNRLNVPPHNDNEWFELYFKVEGKQVTVKVDGEMVVEYEERPEDIKGARCFSSGTIAIQAHDPVSRIFYKDIYVRVLK